jgi:hypothetical protein
VLSIGLGGANTAPTFGLVSTTGKVTLAGSLDVMSTVAPATGNSFELLDTGGNSPSAAPSSRWHRNRTTPWVKKGTRTLTFQISYLGTGGGAIALITRIS